MTVTQHSDTAQDTTSDRGEWRWLWKEVRPLASYQASALACTMMFAALGLVGPLVLKWLIDTVLPNRRWRDIGVATAVLFGATVLRNLLNAVATYIRTLGVERLAYRLRLRLFKRLQGLPAAFYSQQPIGDLVQRVEKDVGLVGELGSDVASTALRMVIEITMTAAALILLDWRLALVVVIVLPILVVLRHRFRGPLQRMARETRELAGRQSNHLNESLTAAVQIQLLGAERWFARRYARLGLETLDGYLRQRRLELTFAFLSTTLIGLGMALIIGYGGIRVLMGTLTTGGLVAFYAYVGNILTPLTTAVELYSRLNRVRASIRRLMDIEAVPDMLQESPDAVPLAGPPRSLTCAAVSFSYGSDATTLRGIDLNLRAGERVALVGESGCGKTSLLKLIPRLYEPTSGGIAIDGRDLRSVPLRSLRRAISIVPQDAMLFRGTIRENVRLANPRATREEIAQAAHIAGLTEVINKQPEGWETMVGPMGSGLSGGEKQRLAIARALLQRRPILILDEATSALDAATEDRLLTRLEEWCAGRLVIVVSHRMAVARWADRVIVLNRGRVAEDGTHDRLYRPGTLYHALWQRGQKTAEAESTPAVTI